jgi:hypothetical protein
MLLEQLAEPDRAGEPARAAADDQNPDIDPLVRRVGRGADRLGVVGDLHQILPKLTELVQARKS